MSTSFRCSKNELEMETIRGKCDRLQESNQNLMTELQEVKEYVRFLSQASLPSDQFRTRPASPQPSDGRQFGASNGANPVDQRTMAVETWESGGPDGATVASAPPNVDNGEATGNSEAERKAYREESAQKSRPTGMREERKESRARRKGPELDRDYGSLESTETSNLVEAVGTERVSKQTETERRSGREDRMSVKHVAAEERQLATGTERNDDSWAPGEAVSPKLESSLKRVGFALEGAGKVGATGWRAAERTETEVSEAERSEKGSAKPTADVEHRAVERVEVGRAEIKRSPRAEKGVVIRNEVDFGDVRVAEAVVVKRADEVVKVGRNLEQSTERNEPKVVEDASKLESNGKPSVKTEVAKATEGRSLEMTADREIAEWVGDGRHSESGAEPKAKNARGAVQVLGPSLSAAVSQESSRKETSDLRDGGSVSDEAAEVDETRRGTAVASLVIESTDRPGAAKESAGTDVRVGKARRTEVEVPATAGHALAPGVTSSRSQTVSDDSPAKGAGSRNLPLGAEGEHTLNDLWSGPSSTGLESEKTSSDASPSLREKPSFSKAEKPSSALDSTLPDSGREAAESERERLQKISPFPEVNFGNPNLHFSERPRRNDFLPMNDPLPAGSAPISRTSEVSVSKGTTLADTLPTDQRKEARAETEELPAKTGSGGSAQTGGKSAELEPHLGEQTEDILDDLDLYLEGLEVAGEASARSAAEAARDGEVFEVHHEESHAQLFTPDDSDIAEEAW
ncbi:hypothetical protein KFL_002660075 [Klebsormidium nitens]|uniref:Uncharacterized protein n=1 Tax=Klebsormidium nitens TaxID=105231 RepID=A0A1Y1ID66_KLENI|nr:hypothetical protein KFL_002660075 [Klebsormidium nitens]|eukprot:GAQ86028.1 hypothetical protein KFL_002660075 [Klebsormidium nitens]